MNFVTNWFIFNFFCSTTQSVPSKQNLTYSAESSEPPLPPAEQQKGPGGAFDKKGNNFEKEKKVLFFAKYDEGDDHPLPRKLLDELKLRQYCENSLYTAECLHRRYILEVVTRRGQKPFEENLAFIEQFRAKIGEQCSEVVNPWEFVDDEPLLEDCLTLVDSGSPVVEALLQRLFRRQLEEEEELRLDREFFLRFAERFSTLFRSTLFFYVILKVVKLCLHLCGYV